jgi:hypothetical protein
MNVETISTALQGRNNKFFTIKVRRPAQVRKSLPGPAIEKESLYQGILCDYANRAPVRDAVQSGERQAPVLPSHINEVFHVNGVKFWRGKNGQEYFPMPITGNKPKVTWYADGIEVPFDDIKEYLLACELSKKPSKEEVEEKDQVLFNSIKVENILEVR